MFRSPLPGISSASIEFPPRAGCVATGESPAFSFGPAIVCCSYFTLCLSLCPLFVLRESLVTLGLKFISLDAIHTLRLYCHHILLCDSLRRETRRTFAPLDRAREDVRMRDHGSTTIAISGTGGGCLVVSDVVQRWLRGASGYPLEDVAQHSPGGRRTDKIIRERRKSGESVSPDRAFHSANKWTRDAAALKRANKAGFRARDTAYVGRDVVEDDQQSLEEGGRRIPREKGGM